MKATIVASLLLNVALLLAAVRRPPPPAWAPNPPPLRALPAPLVLVPPAAGPDLGASTLPSPRRGWDWVESDDLAQLIKNLRAVGCPEQTVQEVACLRLCRSMRQQLLERTAAQQRALAYWKAPSPQDRQEEIASRQGVTDELNAALERLLGEDGWRIRHRLVGFSSAHLGADYLPAEKSRQLRDIERRYRQLGIDRRDIGAPSGFIDEEIVNRSNELHREKLAEIQRVLTPAEYEEWLVHSSKAADYVRRNLPEAQSEEEFRRMVKVAAELEMNQDSLSLSARYGLADDDSHAARALKEKQEDFERRLAQELGQDRINAQREAEAQREQAAAEERARGEAVAMMDEIGVGREDANRLYDRLKTELKPKFEALEKELLPPDATAEQKKAFELRLKVEMEQLATEVIGPEKAKALLQKFSPDPAH